MTHFTLVHNSDPIYIYNNKRLLLYFLNSINYHDLCRYRYVRCTFLDFESNSLNFSKTKIPEIVLTSPRRVYKTTRNIILYSRHLYSCYMTPHSMDVTGWAYKPIPKSHSRWSSLFNVSAIKCDPSIDRCIHYAVPIKRASSLLPAP